MKKSISIILIILGIILIYNFAFAQDGFYSLGSENVEFRNVQTSNNEESMEVYKQDGTPYYVCNTASIDSNDIEDIYIEIDNKKNKSKANISTEYRVTIYFKKSSWLKVRKFTEENISHQIVILKRKVVLFTPIINRPFAVFAREVSVCLNQIV